MKTLSLCMITKNEEKNLKICLDSVKDYVDEIIIVDTGSTDKTLDIAKSYTDKVFNHQWNYDFSEARNKSLEKATKDWILFLDADEKLPKSECIKLKEIINSTKAEGLFLRLENIVENKSLGDAVVLRAFKNNPLYRFKNKIHEQIIFSIEENSGYDKIQPTNIKILHFGYDPKISNLEEKKERNIKILESYKEDNRDGYFYYSLGNEYSRIDEVYKALDMYERGIAYTNQHYDNNMPSYLPYLVINLSKTFASLKKYKSALNTIYNFQNKYPNFRDLYFLESIYLVECGKISKAKNSLLKYLNCDYSHYMFPDNNFEETYNIGKILRELRKKSIPIEENFLDVVFIDTLYDDSLLFSIQSVNEISSLIAVSISISSIIDKSIIEDYYAYPILVNSNSNKDLFISGLRKCKSKFILIMKSRDIIDANMQLTLINFLQNTTENFFNLIITNKNNSSKYAEFRLFRNSEEIQNVKNFDEFMSIVNREKIQTYDITIKKI